MDKPSLEQRISLIENRNKKVEVDKAWETSFLRRGMVALFTYIVMVLVMNTLAVVDPFLVLLSQQ